MHMHIHDMYNMYMHMHMCMLVPCEGPLAESEIHIHRLSHERRAI